MKVSIERRHDHENTGELHNILPAVPHLEGQPLVTPASQGISSAP